MVGAAKAPDGKAGSLRAIDLIAVVRALPARARLTEGFFPAAADVKDALLRYLRQRPQLGQALATTIYEAELDAPDLLWLGEQLGVGDEALRTAHEAVKTSARESAEAQAVRAVIPWARIEPLLHATLALAKQARTALASIDTPQDLLERIELLSPKSPLSDAFAARWNGATSDVATPRESAFAWNDTQYGHWLGWLASYDRQLHGIKEAKRSAEFIYNHISSPRMLIYLAEAVGLSARRLELATTAALADTKSLATMSAAIRKVVSWRTIERALLKK